MDERHEHEQYFFDDATRRHLADFVAGRPSPCCVCAPRLGRELAGRGVAVAVLDVDERFADVPGFRRFDLTRPAWAGAEYGLIVCDPPFFNVSLSQTFDALRLLARFRAEQPLLVSYLKRREAAFLRAFAPFGLRPTGYRPRYETVEDCDKNHVEFYANLGEALHGRLRGASPADGTPLAASP